MRPKQLLIAVSTLAVLGDAAATRVLEQPEGAYEVRLSEVVLPGGAAGYVIFKPCAACDRLSLNVGSTTAYLVERQPVALADFAAAAEGYRQLGASAAVYVFYDVETRRVTRLVLDRLDD